jgi:hypothetical protein
MANRALRIVAGAGLVAGLTLAASASARAQEQTLTPQAPVPYIQRHAVFRPALPIPTRRPLQETGYEFPTKPLFLKGYAGNLYGQAPKEAYIPTGYGTGTIQPVGGATPRPWRPRLFSGWRRY